MTIRPKVKDIGLHLCLLGWETAAEPMRRMMEMKLESCHSHISYVHLRAKLGWLHWLQEKEISFRSTKLAEQECGASMGRIECGEDEEEDDVWPEFCVRQPASDIGCGCGGGRRWVYIFQCTYISKEGGVHILNIYFMRGSSIGLDPRSAVEEMIDIVVFPAFKEYDMCWVL